MGEVRAKVYLENVRDIVLKKEGYIEKIRALEMECMVDTGAVMIMLPQDVVETLGLEVIGKRVVTYADERNEERDIAGAIRITINDRSMNSDCIVGPLLSEALIGQIVMEGLDLVVDCTRQTLGPNPKSPYIPHCKMK